MLFTGYENWQAYPHRVTLHRYDCGHVTKERRGVNGLHGKWHDLGIHPDPGSALSMLRTTRPVSQKTVIRCCGHCLDGTTLRGPARHTLRWYPLRV